MSGPLALIASGLDLREEHIEDAIESREATKALLVRLSEVSAPDTGVAKALLVYARMATTACAWIDGDLCIDLLNDVNVTSVHTFTELGGGMRERLFPPLAFRAPLAELARSIARVPHMIAPLAIQSSTPQRIRLAASAIVRRTTVPPPLIGIAHESLFVPAGAPRVPASDDLLDLPLPIVTLAPSVEEPEPATLPVHVPLEAPRSPPLPGPASPSERSSEPPLHDLDSGWDE